LWNLTAQIKIYDLIIKIFATIKLSSIKLNVLAVNMNHQEELFQKEEDVLRESLAFLKETLEQNEQLPTKYRELVNHYKKLLKQTKLLVKVSDRQQRDKINEVQQTVLTNEKRLAQILEAIPLGVLVVDHERNPYYANRAAFNIFNVHSNSIKSIEQLLNLYDQSIIYTVNDYSIHCLPLEEALLYGNICNTELNIVLNHKVIPLEISGIPIFDHKERVNYAIGIFKDISERKHAEEINIRHSKEIEEKNHQLIELNKEKNEFLGVVAHDLKNPLGAILGFSELLLEIVSDTEMKDYVKTIKNATKSMLTLVTTLLDVNVIDSGKINFNLKYHDVLPILNGLLMFYKKAASNKNITIHFETTQPSYIAFVDENIVRQILDNLVSNAIKYSPLGKNIYIRLIDDRKNIKCEIEDEGQGLSKEDLSKLFNKFARLNPQPTAGEHSTGLGLFIVKKLVEKMSGKVWCKSELGKGSTFIIELVRGEQ